MLDNTKEGTTVTCNNFCLSQKRCGEQKRSDTTEGIPSDSIKTKIQKQKELIYREGKQVVSGKARGGEES